MLRAVFIVGLMGGPAFLGMRSLIQIDLDALLHLCRCRWGEERETNRGFEQSNSRRLLGKD